jgi:Zn-dependent M28 family amino/carboxypeptidase
VELVVTNRRANPLTVEARLPARAGAAPGFFLFCAHGDSDAGGPGANDNGSGEAIVYEIARAWTAAIQAGALPPPPAEVRFAIWGKEIFSTQHYLKTIAAEEGPVLGVINYDQAGFGSSSEQLNVEPDDLPANVALVWVIAGVLADHAGQAGFPERWATNKSLGGTDSYVFSGSQRFREDLIPAVTLFTSAWDVPAEHPRTPGMPGESWSDRDRVYVDYDVYYHSAGDRPENTTDLEPHNMAWCARVGWFSALRWLAR